MPLPVRHRRSLFGMLPLPAWGSVLLALGILWLTASASLGAPHPPAHPTSAPIAGRTAALAGSRAGEPGLHRLIIKFRDPAPGDPTMLASTTAPQRIQALGLGGALQTPRQGRLSLSYLKSVTPHTHVALTSQRLPRAELLALSRRLAQDPQVEYAEIDEILHPLMVPNDTFYGTQQWNLQSAAIYPGSANLPVAWDSATGSGVVVAVLDTGYRPHVDLAANVLAGYDFISDATTANDGNGRDSDAQDPGDWSTTANCDTASNSDWHGTHMAGIIAAVGNNSIGVIGVAFGAKILPVRVLGSCGGYLSDIAAGMLWAAGLAVSGVPANTHPAQVLNLSLGVIGPCSATFQSAVNAVRNAGSVVVVSTGNESQGSLNQPANCPGVMAVTAHTKAGDNASYANVGLGTALSAPGGGYGAVVTGDGSSIYSTYNTGNTTPRNDSYTHLQGTSMATAHVAGVAALLYQLRPGITPDGVLSALTNSARAHPVGTYCAGRTTCGAGLLDAQAAVARVMADIAPTVAASATPAGVVIAGATVHLTGAATPGSDGSTISAHLWTQLAGPAVSLTGANTAQASFVVPAGGGSFTFSYKATASNGSTASSWVSVQTNTAPVLAPIAAQTVVAGGNLVFTVTATDAEGDTVQFVDDGLPAGASFNAYTGVFTWNNASPPGSYSITITPSDGLLNGASQSVRVTVTAASAGSQGGGATDWPEGLLLALLAAAVLAWRWRLAHPSR